MSKKTGSLSKVFAANIAVIRPDTGMGKNMLIELVAPRHEYFLANRTSCTRFVYPVLMILQLSRRRDNNITLSTFVTLFVQQQMIVETSLILKFLDTQMAREF